MVSVKFTKFLLILVIISGLLGACKARNKAVSSQKVDNVTLTKNPANNPQDLSHNIEELEASYNNFQQALDKFLIELKHNFSNNSSEQDINLYKNVNKKLEEFRQVFDKTSINIKNDNHKLPTEIEEAINKLETTIKKLEKVISPFQDGVNRKALDIVAKELNIKSYNLVSNNTYEEIDDFLVKKKSKITEIFKILKDEFPDQTLVKIQKLEQQSQNTSNLQKTLTIILIITLCLAVAVMIVLLDKILEKDQIFQGSSNNQIELEPSEIPDSEDRQKSIELTNKLDNIIEKQSHHIHELETRLQAIENNSKYNHNSQQSNNDYYPRSNKFNPDKGNNLSESKRILPYKNLVNSYNYNYQFFLNKNLIIKVSESETSINSQNKNSTSILENTNNGNYWIIKQKEIYYLVPKIDIIINQYNYNTLKKLFICFKEQSENYRKFQILKPAIVINSSENDKEWKLKEKGVIQFESQK